MTKLNDTQLVILSAAARRANGAVLPVPAKLKVTPETHGTRRHLRRTLKRL